MEMSVARALSEYQKWQSQREYEAQAEKKEKKNKGFFEELVDGVESVAKGIGYVGESLFLGAARGVEGIIDYTFGGIGDLFGADDFADDMMKTDFLNYNHANDWYNPNKVMSFVGDVGQGIGNMLPAIAVTAVSGGTAVPAAVAAGTATFGVSAAGQATSDVAKKNGSVGAKEWLYGTASGAAEAGIEAISGGIGGTQAGKVLGKQMAKTTGGKLATAFVSEGLEEVAADFVDPFLKRTTGVDKNASVDWQNLPRTFLLGGTTGAVMGGGQRAIRAARMGGYNNLNAAENAQTLDERLADNNMRQAKGKKLTYTQEDLAFVQERLSTNLQKMSADKRAAFFAENKRIAPYFNADGTVKGFASVKKNGENTSFSAAQNKNLATVGARYSVQKAVGGKDVVVVDSNILDGVPKKEWVKTVKTAIKQFNGGIPISGKLIKVNADTGSEYTNSKDSQYYKNHNAVIYKDKLNAANNLDEIVLASTNYVNEDLNHKRKDNIKEFARGEVLMEIGGRKYNANVIVGFTSGQNMVLYDVIDFVPAQFSLRQKEKTRFPENRSSQTMETMSSTDSIRQTEEKVNGFDENSSKNSSSRKYLGGDEYADNVSTNSQTIGKVNEDAYSASLKGRESTLKYQPVSTSEVPTDIAKNVMNTITKLTNGRVNIVLTSAEMLSADGQRVNGEYADGVLYLNANATDAERAMFVGAHELMHSLEGTSEYGALADFITEQIKSDPALAEKYDIEKYEEAYANAQEKEYSKETKRYEAETEVFADFIAREVLSKEDTARRLVNRNRNVVVRMLDWVRGAIERL
ncbi:MAG: hypothetical protein J6U60_02560, partial [Clostridia bacterium]|nr:hypothetical protein [Clostridia bacterium]